MTESSNTETAIKVVNVGKTFRLPHEKSTSIKSLLIDFRKRRTYELQQALDDVSFEIKKGEFFGIVGRNGSGKSTILKLLAGIYSPNSGSIAVNGSLTPFIELGVGFNPELTGQENVFLNGALLGFNRKELQAMYSDIVDFAELHNFMDQKLKNYSSGMQVRLAFAIATRVGADILIVDEVLAVGDAAFQRKCFDYFMYLKRSKKTVVLVTHDMGAIRQFCDRAVMIDDGKITSQGTPEEVAQAYQMLFSKEIAAEKFGYDNTEDKKNKRWGTKKLRADKPEIVVKSKRVIFNCKFKATQDIPAPILGFNVHGPAGENVLESNTQRERLKTKPMKKGDTVKITWDVPNIFKTGDYSLTVACCDQSKVEFYDWFNEAGSFSINKVEPTGGLVDPEIEISDYQVMPDKANT